MLHKPVSLIEFILEEERKFKDATGNLTLLLTQLEYAAKIIASHIRRAGLVDILGKTGETNVHSEEVQKLDIFANSLLVDVLSQTKTVSHIASEEMDEILIPHNGQGDYSIFFDPLDGSSNIDADINVGTIFSIYKKSDSLQPGNKQVAAGYIMYGPSDIFVYTSRNGVNGFSLDPSVGSFILSHPSIHIPASGDIYSVNEANSMLWEDQIKKYIDSLKDGKHKSRYVGSLIADIHRTLLKGGIFLYPADKKSPHGKLRLMYEVNPMSFIIEQASGKAISGNESPLAISPSSLHQKVPAVFGSPENIEQYLSFFT